MLNFLERQNAISLHQIVSMCRNLSLSLRSVTKAYGSDLGFGEWWKPQMWSQNRNDIDLFILQNDVVHTEICCL